MATEFEKKLRKFFRKCQRKNLGLGFKGGVFKLVGSLPLEEYQKIEPNLSADELYELRENLKVYGLEEAFFYMIKPHTWYYRCCADMRLFDSFSDEQLGKILNTKQGNISSLFFADGQNAGRRLRILKLLSENSLESWIKLLSTCDYQLLQVKMPGGFDVPTNKGNKKLDAIFEKLATLSDDAVAKLMEISTVGTARRLLQEVICLERDVFSICEEIEKDKLYDVVIVKLDLLKDADVEKTKIMYSYLAYNIPQRDKFFSYLLSNKQRDIKLFDEDICAEMYGMMGGNQAGDFVRRVFEQKEAQSFEGFYDELSLEERIRMLGDLLKDESGRKIIRAVFGGKEKLEWYEEAAREKSITQTATVVV